MAQGAGAGAGAGAGPCMDHGPGAGAGRTRCGAMANGDAMDRPTTNAAVCLVLAASYPCLHGDGVGRMGIDWEMHV